MHVLIPPPTVPLIHRMPQSPLAPEVALNSQNLVYFSRLSLKQAVYFPLPKPPAEPTVLPHWLFIEGVQPITPENAAIERPVAKRVKQEPQSATAVDTAAAAGSRKGLQAAVVTPAVTGDYVFLFQQGLLSSNFNDTILS